MNKPTIADEIVSVNGDPSHVTFCGIGSHALRLAIEMLEIKKDCNSLVFIAGRKLRFKAEGYQLLIYRGEKLPRYPNLGRWAGIYSRMTDGSIQYKEIKAEE